MFLSAAGYRDSLRELNPRVFGDGEKISSVAHVLGLAPGVVMFDDVFVPWDRVFLAGEWRYSHLLTRIYATHHRHSCIGARVC